MSQHVVKVVWKRGRGERYVDNHYSRGHSWVFDGGITVPASSSPHVVPVPYSVENHVDPEEAFVAALSSCHMLFFLAVAAKRKFVVDAYVDNAIGTMEKNADGKLSMTQVILRPQVTFTGQLRPSKAQIEEMHHQSHDQCFIANSVKTEVTTQIGA